MDNGKIEICAATMHINMKDSREDIQNISPDHIKSMFDKGEGDTRNKKPHWGNGCEKK